MTKMTIKLPDTIRLFTKANHELATLDTSKLPVDLMERLVPTALRVLLMNAYNGGGKDASEAERTAALDKKIAAWYRGEPNVTERGESFYTAWKDTFIATCVAAGMTVKAADDAIRATVTDRLGKDTKASFANYIEACALNMVDEKQFDDADAARDALEAYYADATAKRLEAAAKSSAKIVVPTIDLSAFKKA